ncbi:hypothetical protein ACFV4F_30875 [Kitasatospora sp. NPDC059722]|uniref:hypothetical protein n=1 Tax=unclassified Kitasatospora TaxID=2633591 RepID=UPI0036480144
MTAEPSAVPVVWAPAARVEPAGAVRRADPSTPVQRRTSPLLPLQGLGENYQAAAPPGPPPPVRAPADPGTVAVAAGIAQRMPDGSVVFAPPAPQPAEPPSPEPPPPPVQRAEAHTTAAPTAAPTAPPPAPPESTDELVRRLIDPLGRLLRAELRQDRERAGLRFDTHPYH